MAYQGLPRGINCSLDKFLLQNSSQHSKIKPVLYPAATESLFQTKDEEYFWYDSDIELVFGYCGVMSNNNLSS
jgi:hypothetical protein